MQKQDQDLTKSITDQNSKESEGLELKKSTAVYKSEPHRGDYKFLYWDQ